MQCCLRPLIFSCLFAVCLCVLSDSFRLALQLHLPWCISVSQGAVSCAQSEWIPEACYLDALLSPWKSVRVPVPVCVRTVFAHHCDSRPPASRQFTGIGKAFRGTGRWYAAAVERAPVGQRDRAR
ncbi:hypothetical protein UPYG_G00306630 [Umbra pygmaea]|uniref:Secreted protein n=1 Tax=Umbra pygmaea TaxID=75934 RepID=A0ABD0W335_UMBPY